MDDRTLSYVRGRFGDYYRKADIEPPRSHDEREWGYIPFTTGGVRMVRHKSLLDLGSLGGWLANTKPRHVYYSSARYSRPEADNMNEKGWLGADLIFDLDADHLEGVTPDDSYSDMLEECKQALLRLLEFIDDDFGFRDVEVAFSGGRGYHVHVYDDEVQRLESQARREIVDYVRGIGFQPELAFSGETAAGDYGRTPTEVRRLNEGAWGERIKTYVLDYADRVAELPDGEALERLQQRDGVGEKKARKILGVFRERRGEIRTGNLDVAGGLKGFWDGLIEEAVRETSAETDEPVTTDTRRLIRLPGSLHGGTGLRVTKLGREELRDFEPLRDAVVFSDHDQTVEVNEGGAFEVGGTRFNMDAGKNILPEYAAVYAMLRFGAELG